MCCTLGMAGRLLVLIPLGITCTAAAAADQVFLLPFFKDSTDQSIYLAYSRDGCTFSTVNGGKPILSGPSAFGAQNLTRDPSITYHDGAFQMVWTTGWTGTTFGCASSTDLKGWSNIRLVTPFQSGQEQPNNVWAPEVFYDQVAGNYKIAWASTLPSELAAHTANGTNVDGYANHLYYTTTNDFITFAPAKVFFDQGGDVIDGQVAYDDRGTPAAADDRWVMAVKTTNHAKTDRVVRLTYSSPVITDNGWSTAGLGVAGTHTSLNSGRDAEGPTLLNNGEQWLLYWDVYTGNDWGMASSPDLSSWTDLTSSFHLYDVDGSEIVHPRHGTVFLAPASAVGFAEVPEPASLAIVLLATGVLSGRHRKK